MSIANPTLEDVWQLFRENAAQLAAKQKENDRQFQENDRQLQELRQENDRQFQEFRREGELFRKEIRYAIKEMSQTVAELSQKTKELENLFTTQWGRLVETLVEGTLVRIFNDWGISVNCTLTRLKGNYQGQGYEFDIIVYNGDVLIIVEVKTTLRPNDVKKFVKKLGLVKNWLPRYANNQIYGAMAFLHADAGADQMVVNKNMFAIRATGDSAHILNSKGFIPKVW